MKRRPLHKVTCPRQPTEGEQHIDAEFVDAIGAIAEAAINAGSPHGIRAIVLIIADAEGTTAVGSVLEPDSEAAFTGILLNGPAHFERWASHILRQVAGVTMPPGGDA